MVIRSRLRAQQGSAFQASPRHLAEKVDVVIDEVLLISCASGWLAGIIRDCVEFTKTMPKLKSRKAAAKRFRRTGSGKIVRRKAFKNHLLQHKSPTRKSRLSKLVVVNERDAENVEMMLPYL